MVALEEVAAHAANADIAGATLTAPAAPIDGPAIAALVSFLLSVAAVIALVLYPVTITVPSPCFSRLERLLRPKRRHQQRQQEQQHEEEEQREHGHNQPPRRRPAVRVRVPHWAAPPLGVVAMVAAGALDARGVVAGLKGDDAIQPYAILVVFLSLAYVAAAEDQTGALAWLALKMTRAARTGRRLFGLHTLLSGCATLATSNDVVVMSLTPIVHTQAVAGGAEAVPYLATMFVAANLWSMALFIGNPTNLVRSAHATVFFVLCVAFFLHTEHHCKHQHPPPNNNTPNNNNPNDPDRSSPRRSTSPSSPTPSGCWRPPSRPACPPPASSSRPTAGDCPESSTCPTSAPARRSATP